jgi:uncharacterized lipoprotein YddW (UPF0748 family)/sugar lactone lactonase YvrE
MMRRILWPPLLLALFTASSPRADEIRAIWVTRWDYATPPEVTAILDNVAAHNFNTVLFQVRGNGTTFYPSALEPWAWELTGSGPSTLGTDPGWNPLALAVSHGHSLGLEIHAYMNTFPGWRGTVPPPGTTPLQLWFAHPDWFCVDSGGNPMTLNSGYVVLSPGILAVQDYLTDVYAEVVGNFGVDGIHLDYVRHYGGQYSHDPESLARFAAEYPGANPSTHPAEWEQWRRDQVTALVASIEAETHTVKPDCQVTAAVWSSHSSGSTTYGQDSWGWLSAGALDVAHAMNYTTSVNTHRSRTESHILNAHDRFSASGIGAHLLGGAPATLLAQVKNTRDLGTHGVTVFAYSSLFPGHAPNGLADALVTGPTAPFQFPDEPPVRRWLTGPGDDDNTGPRIFNVQTDPSPPVRGEPFDVLADVTDASGVFDDASGSEGQGVHLRCAIEADSAGGAEIQMSWQGGDTYATDAPVTVGSLSTVHLQITAHDDDADSGPADRAARESAIHSFEVGAAPLYVFDAEIGPTLTLPQYAVMDPQGMLWVCDYSADRVRVFDQSGNLAPFDPVTAGLDGSGAVIDVDAPSGIACSPDGTIFVTLDDAYDAPLYAGIVRFTSATCTPVTGIDLHFRPGDCDLDADGELYVVEKIVDRWHVLSPPGAFTTDTAFGSGGADHTNRGIACRDNGARVFIASSAEGAIHAWSRTSTGPLTYAQGADVAAVTGVSGAVDVDAHGWLFAADAGVDTVCLYDDTDALMQEIRGGTPTVDTPRGVAHTPDSDFIFIVPFTGNAQVQRWVRQGPFPGVPAELAVFGAD